MITKFQQVFQYLFDLRHILFLSLIKKASRKIEIESAMIEQSNRIGDFINNGSNWIFKPAIAIDMDLRSHFVSDRHR